MTARAETWLQRLVSPAEFAMVRRRHGVLCCDALLLGHPVRLLAVVPDAANPYPRARGGEVGLLQGWALAHAVREMIAADAGGQPRAVIALVDVPSQAYGRTEEALGLSLALAAAVDAYASARMAHHASVALILGRAFSGAFLAHGYQASRILALDAPSVQIQAMGREAAMRVTRRSEEELAEAALQVPPMAYDLEGFGKLGILHATIPCSDANDPSREDVLGTLESLGEAVELARQDGPYLAPRFGLHNGTDCRDASREVQARMQAMWGVDAEEGRP